MTSKKLVKRSRTFQCVCYDEILDAVSGSNKCEDSSPMVNNSRQVSFADENGDFCSAVSASGDTASSSASTLPAKGLPSLCAFDHYSQCYFSQLPKYLLLNLNRFAPDDKMQSVILKTINQLLIPSCDLDLFPHSLASQSEKECPGYDMDRNQFKYSLAAVVAHRGRTFSDGEYITYLKIAPNQLKDDQFCWIKFENSGQNVVNINVELKSQFVRENALVLMYEKLED